MKKRIVLFLIFSLLMVSLAWATFLGAWNKTLSYNIGDTVTYGGFRYDAKIPNSNQAPFLLSPYWQPISGPGSSTQFLGVEYHQSCLNFTTNRILCVDSANTVCIGVGNACIQLAGAGALNAISSSTAVTGMNNKPLKDNGGVVGPVVYGDIVGLWTTCSSGYLKYDGTCSDSGGSMVYPGTGIPLSTGSAWGSSITNNSSNWNTAYGWGNWAHTTLSGYGITDALGLHGKADTCGVADSATGNAGTVTNGVYTSGGQTIAGTETFSGGITLSGGTALTLKDTPVAYSTLPNTSALNNSPWVIYRGTVASPIPAAGGLGSQNMFSSIVTDSTLAIAETITHPVGIRSFLRQAAGTGNSIAIQGICEADTGTAGSAGCAAIHGSAFPGTANTAVFGGWFQNWDQGYCAHNVGVEINSNPTCSARTAGMARGLNIANFPYSIYGNDNDWGITIQDYGKGIIFQPVSVPTATTTAVYIWNRNTGSSASNAKTSIMTFEDSQPGAYAAGFDFRNATFTNGVMILPNDQYIRGVSTGATVYDLIGLDDANILNLGEGRISGTLIPNSLVQSGGPAYIGNYTLSAHPSSANNGTAFGFNYSNGGAETDIYNTFVQNISGSNPGGFTFWQKTGSATAVPILNLINSGTSNYIDFGAWPDGSDPANGYGIRDDNGTIKVKNSGGSWGTIATGGAGDMLLGTAQSVTAEKKFTKDKLSILGTSTGKNIISTANTSATDYTNTLPAKDGTVAMTSDITGTNSGTNTGDNATNTQYSGLATSKQDALGFTPENTANKRTSFQSTPDDTHYPSEKLVKDSLDGKQASGSYLTSESDPIVATETVGFSITKNSKKLTVADNANISGTPVIDLNVLDYGAKGDTIVGLDGAVVASGTTFTSAGATFTSADTGKTLLLYGAGTAGRLYQGTVTYASVHTLTISPAATGTVTASEYVLGTDDGPAIQTMLNNNTSERDYLTEYLGSSHKQVIVRFPSNKHFLIATPISLSHKDDITFTGGGLISIADITAFSFAGCRRITIERLYADGLAYDYEPITSTFVYFTYANDNGEESTREYFRYNWIYRVKSAFLSHYAPRAGGEYNIEGNTVETKGIPNSVAFDLGSSDNYVYRNMVNGFQTAFHFRASSNTYAENTTWAAYDKSDTTSQYGVIFDVRKARVENNVFSDAGISELTFGNDAVTYGGIIVTGNAFYRAQWSNNFISFEATSPTTVLHNITVKDNYGFSIVSNDSGKTVNFVNTTIGTAIIKDNNWVSSSLVAVENITGSSAKTINIIGGNATTLLGSIPYQSDTDTTTLLAPNVTTTKKFLRETGDATNGTAPAWDTLASSDIPSNAANTSGTAAKATILETARTIGGVSFDGSAPITVASATGGFAVSGGNLTVGTTSTGGNTGIVATRNSELITQPMVTGDWTLGSDGTGGWSITGGSLSKTVSAGTQTATPTASMGITAGTTYEVIMTLSAVGSTPCSYTLGGVVGKTLTATTFTDVLTPITTANIIFSGAAAATCTITSLSVKALVDNTGDLIVDGNLILKSPIKDAQGNNVISIANGNVAIGTTDTAYKLHISAIAASPPVVIVTNSTTDSHTSSLTLRKNSVNSETPTTTGSGDILGGISFAGVNAAGTNAFASGAQIRAIQNGTAGSSYVPTDIYFTTSSGTANVAERMRINYAGNVGIGTTAPSQKLQVSGNALIADESSLSAEKMSNGTFTGNANSWTLGTGLTYSSNTVMKDGDGTGTLSQTSVAMVTPLVPGEVYKLTFVLSNVNVADSLTVTCGGVTVATKVSASATFTYTFSPTSTADLVFTPTIAASRFTIDTISLKKVQAGDLYVINNIGVGTTLSTARLNLPANTSYTGYAPLKFDLTSTVLKTTAVAGEVEVTPTHFYWTDNAGTRWQLDQQSGLSGDYSVGNCGTSVTLNFAQGQTQYLTLDQTSCAITFSGAVNGYSYVIRLIQGGTGKLATFPTIDGTTNGKWAGGVAPVLTTTSDKQDIITCRYSNNVYYCDAVTNF